MTRAAAAVADRPAENQVAAPAERSRSPSSIVRSLLLFRRRNTSCCLTPERMATWRTHRSRQITIAMISAKHEVESWATTFTVARFFLNYTNWRAVELRQGGSCSATATDNSTPQRGFCGSIPALTRWASRAWKQAGSCSPPRLPTAVRRRGLNGYTKPTQRTPRQRERDTMNDDMHVRHDADPAISGNASTQQAGSFLRCRLWRCPGGR